jgi:hypothetical protein
MKRFSSNCVRLEETSFAHVYINILERLNKRKPVDKEVKYTKNEKESKWFLIYSLIYKNDPDFHIPTAVYKYLVCKAKQKMIYLR